MGADSQGQFCKSCDYPLGGVGGAVCPECGRGFDAADPGTFAARPGVRRRRWMRRGVYALGVIVLVELFAPSRVAKLTWSWPNADGVTATSETRWCLVAPRWLPIRYPRWCAPRWSKPIESGGLVYSEFSLWTIGAWSWHFEGVAPVGGFDTSRYKGAIGSIHVEPSADSRFIDVIPKNIDALCDAMLDPQTKHVMYGVHAPVPRETGDDRRLGQ